MCDKGEWVTSVEAAEMLKCSAKGVYDVMRRWGDVERKQDPGRNHIAYLYRRTDIEKIIEIRDPLANKRGRINTPGEDHPWTWRPAASEGERRPRMTPEEWAAVVERARQRVIAQAPHREIQPDRAWLRAMGEDEQR